MARLSKETQAYKNKLKYIKEFNKKKAKQYTLSFNKEYDKELIEWLDSLDNKTDYIRQLILQDMKNKG